MSHLSEMALIKFNSQVCQSLSYWRWEGAGGYAALSHTQSLVTSGTTSMSKFGIFPFPTNQAALTMKQTSEQVFENQQVHAQWHVRPSLQPVNQFTLHKVPFSTAATVAMPGKLSHFFIYSRMATRFFFFLTISMNLILKKNQSNFWSDGYIRKNCAESTAMCIWSAEWSEQRRHSTRDEGSLFWLENKPIKECFCTDQKRYTTTFHRDGSTEHFQSFKFPYESLDLRCTVHVFLLAISWRSAFIRNVDTLQITAFIKALTWGRTMIWGNTIFSYFS